MLRELINDESITEIIINGYDNIHFEKEGKIHQYPKSFATAENYELFVRNLCADCNLDLNVDQPFLNSSWQRLRVHAVFNSISQSSPLLTLRRQRSHRWSFNKLIHAEFCEDHMENLHSLVLKRKSLLFIGISGTGKTSLLEACLTAVPKNDRCAIVEDTKELHLPNRTSFRLLTQSFPNSIDQLELIRQSLRMRPDRIILGELRGSECKDFLMSLSTGHTGSMASLHARDPREALLRLEMLTQLSAPQWSLNSIRKLIFLSIDAIVLIQRIGSQRKISGIFKPASIEADGITLDMAFEQE